ncbi:Uncharacterized protein OBRU01_13232 [Operophtera brumata]|uniref:Luciferin 4-monooxygenase n=1 Tax=Operophtera brumata TaxID=104452 RepID=A0A0L7L9L4_OPEBR|nr:Uncharacterized protein OBRU01_13232 [Operophtera brumata]
MSYSVVRGKPYASQLYLDGILDEVLQSGVTGAKGREGINGVTGEKITNFQILKQATSIAHTLFSKGARGRNVMFVMRNHQAMAAVYFAVLFAGTVPFIMFPNTTVSEITHFLKLIEPCMVFCDEEHHSDVNKALESIPEMKTEVKMSDKEELLKDFANGHYEEPDDFQIFHSQFPRPTECCMLLSPPQWITFTNTVTTCVVYRVPVLMSKNKPTVEWVKEMLVTFRPTWTFFGPEFVKTLLPAITEAHLSSLKCLLVLGAPSSIELMAALKEKLPSSAILGDVYGTTETQGYITTVVPGERLKSTGQVLVDDNGKKLGLCQSGELYVKGPSTIKGYYKNQEAYEEAFSDGWFRTGDLFYIDENERLFYLERKKFGFKFMRAHVSPEEVELVIGSVPGVAECVVCATETGPAAMVIVQHAGDVTREQIHNTVKDTLSEHKQLHAGIAFVRALPHTHSGKIKREECKKLVQELISVGECF